MPDVNARRLPAGASSSPFAGGGTGAGDRLAFEFASHFQGPRLYLKMVGRQVHVLAVEDDVIDARFIERAGIESGLFQSLRVLGSAEEAQVYLRGEAPYADRSSHPFPNLLLLDLKLRGIGGLEFLRWVRQTPALRGLPVVVLTGLVGASALNRAYELGIEAYLVKPLGVRELSTTLAGVLVTLSGAGPPVSPAGQP